MTEHAASSLPDPTSAPAVASPAASTSPPLWPTARVEPQPVMAWRSPNRPAQRLPWGRARSLRPLRWREILAVVLVVALCDATIFRGKGFAGLAALFLLAPGLLLWGSPRPRLHTSFWVVGGMLLALAARMVWLGSTLGAIAGFALLVAMALAIAGRRPYVLDIAACAVQTTVAGYLGLLDYQRSSDQLRRKGPSGYRFSVILPLAALALFGTLFILANPDLARSAGDLVSRFFSTLWNWVQYFVPSWNEILFWFVTGWVVIGLLRPILRRPVLSEYRRTTRFTPALAAAYAESPLYDALRNMLLAVIGLFAVYLAFEFTTLWFREFPKGFYYAGYAHEGAAWLTVALALATLLLSLVFRGRVLNDPRLPQLRRLAWLWSAENLILGAAVYNRLLIYVGFNGMTRMRTVGIFGISAVMVGFVLVVWKIAYQRDFVWLLRRHLWTLALAAYLFALTPVDALVHAYNVRRILAGDLAPSVQIGWHPISAEGLLVLSPLMDCEDSILREGIQALLARDAMPQGSGNPHREAHWTTVQLSDRLLSAKLGSIREEWEPYVDTAKRDAAWQRFREYVYQWY